MNKSVSELLFNGYRDPILEIKTAMDQEDEYDFDVFDEYEDYEDYEKHEDVVQTDDNDVPMDKFGWFYKVHNSLPILPLLLINHISA